MTPANGIKAIWTSMCINSQKINYFTNPPKTDLCVHSEVDYKLHKIFSLKTYQDDQDDLVCILKYVTVRNLPYVHNEPAIISRDSYLGRRPSLFSFI